jgi:hypothetical protein
MDSQTTGNKQKVALNKGNHIPPIELGLFDEQYLSMLADMNSSIQGSAKKLIESKSLLDLREDV